MAPDVLLSLVESLGPMGFVLYMVWRFQSHTIPRIVAENHESQERQREDFKEVVARQRDDFKAILHREQQVHEEQTTRIVKAIENLSDAA